MLLQASACKFVVSLVVQNGNGPLIAVFLKLSLQFPGKRWYIARVSSPVNLGVPWNNLPQSCLESIVHGRDMWGRDSIRKPSKAIHCTCQ